MTPLEHLDLEGLRILDGAMATELEKRGCDITGPLWSARVIADHPDAIAGVHADYLESGADCVLTASYQVSGKAYADAGLSSQDADDALRLSVALAESARARYRRRTPRRIWIAASLGPYGAALHNGAEYHGNYLCTFDDLVAFHRHRLAVLDGTSADFVAFETVPSIDEARAIVAALHCFPQIGAWISFTCKDGEHLAHGEPLAECGSLIETERQVIAAGINCTHPRWLQSLLSELKEATSKPIVVYPNSGEQWDAENRCWRGASDSSDFGSWARLWYAAGAQAVGGCCRTGPDHIRAVRRSLEPKTG